MSTAHKFAVASCLAFFAMAEHAALISDDECESSGSECSAQLLQSRAVRVLVVASLPASFAQASENRIQCRHSAETRQRLVRRAVDSLALLRPRPTGKHRPSALARKARTPPWSGAWSAPRRLGFQQKPWMTCADRRVMQDRRAVSQSCLARHIHQCFWGRELQRGPRASGTSAASFGLISKVLPIRSRCRMSVGRPIMVRSRVSKKIKVRSSDCALQLANIEATPRVTTSTKAPSAATALAAAAAVAAAAAAVISAVCTTMFLASLLVRV